MIVPDVNLLVYAYDSEALHHAPARAWWEDLLGRRQPVGIPWVVALGFVRLMTSRTAMMRPMPATRALAHVRSWLAWPSVDALHPGPRHLDVLEAFDAAGAIQASLVTAAHVAAIAIELGATVHSNDADFGRFPGLRWKNPLREG